MRILLLCATLSFFGCGNNAIPPNDLSVAPDLQSLPDLSASGDMAKGPLTCGAFITCVTGCGNAQGCATACFMRLTPKGSMKLNTLIGCGMNACALTGDAGSGECSGAGDMSQACLQCSLGIIQGGGCPSELTACMNDTL